MTNPTVAKFGYPETLIREFDHWVVLLRPAQVTLGSLVLAAKSDATAYGEMPTEAFAEQGRIVALIEKALRDFTRYERINYLMLMMIDPNVHFHVIPRYESFRQWRGLKFPDRAWPGPPGLKSAVALEPDQIVTLVRDLQATFR